MKKVIMCMLLLAMVVVSACSNGGDSKKDERTLQDFISVYVEAGVEVDPNEKPFFEMIKAKDGVIFNMDGSPVKIYEYESTDKLNDSLKESGFSEWPTNGRFALETNNDAAADVFKNVQ
ncbi:hypothetical protein [Paenibacillus paeoniae]|uniref:Uncharacterized protein n=1 Tax=Paenibacillus paeoniae TaxID=2292705 RepID=A0A371P6H4_9BACL|nr:hypothetical protein [Paenibacillus paeoniae]REK71502.1 hypothetical protein DX130_21110 [Paenibacillus paeoniae]